MASKGQRVEHVDGDGNCLVQSFCDLYNKTVVGWLPAMRTRVENIAGEFRIPIPHRLDTRTLRRVFAEYLRKYWTYYWDQEVFRNEIIEEMDNVQKDAHQTDHEYKMLMRERYERHVLGDGNWLRAPEIDAGAEIFGVRVLVFINQHLDPDWLRRGVNIPDRTKMYESPLALVYTPTTPPNYLQEWLIYHESMVHYEYVTPEPTFDGPGGTSFLGGPPPPGPPPGQPPPSAADMKKAMGQITHDAAVSGVAALRAAREEREKAEAAAKEAARKQAAKDQEEQLRKIREARTARFQQNKPPPAAPPPPPAPKPMMSAAQQQKARIAELLAEERRNEEEELKRAAEARAETRRKQAEQDAILAALKALSTEASKEPTPEKQDEANELVARLQKEEEEAKAELDELRRLQAQQMQEQEQEEQPPEDPDARMARILSEVGGSDDDDYDDKWNPFG